VDVIPALINGQVNKMRHEIIVMLKKSADELEDSYIDGMMSEEDVDRIQESVDNAAKAIRKAIAADNSVTR
jgi:hypothetical protein